jgi:hypothetical protein
MQATHSNAPESRGAPPSSLLSGPSANLSSGGATVVLTKISEPLHWLSVLMRAAIGSLFLCAAVVKTPLGVGGVVAYYTSLFKNSMLPSGLVTAHASAIVYLEYAAALWLLSGYRLPLAWRAASLLLLSLATGMIFAGRYDVASANYLYLLFCVLGMLSEPWDRWSLGRRTGHPDQAALR